MLSSDDLTQWEALLKTCDGLNEQLTNLGDVLSREDIVLESAEMWADEGDDAPQLEQITGSAAASSTRADYDGPFSDGRHDAQPQGADRRGNLPGRGHGAR